MTQHQVTLRNRGGQRFFVDEDERILDALERQGIVLPVACRYGGCVTCAGKLVRGEVDQREGVALKQRQRDAGYVLLCIAKPRADCELEVGVECQDALYENPFRRPRG